MVLIVGLALLILFDIAALRWGADSTLSFEDDLRRVIRAPRRAI
jgi:hypothetical protein